MFIFLFAFFSPSIFVAKHRSLRCSCTALTRDHLSVQQCVQRCDGVLRGFFFFFICLAGEDNEQWKGEVKAHKCPCLPVPANQKISTNFEWKAVGVGDIMEPFRIKKYILVQLKCMVNLRAACFVIGLCFFVTYHWKVCNHVRKQAGWRMGQTTDFYTGDVTLSPEWSSRGLCLLQTLDYIT